MKRKTLEFAIWTAIKTVPVALILSLGLSPGVMLNPATR
jgi:hypothetical protein